MTDKESMDTETNDFELDALLDGELNDADMVDLAERLQIDAQLRGELRGQARLRRLTADLPGELEPGRDLFPEIAARLEPRQGEVKPGPWGRPRVQKRSQERAPRSRTLGNTWTQALAAVLGIALGVAVTWTVLTGTPFGEGAAAPLPDSASDVILASDAQSSEAQSSEARQAAQPASFASDSASVSAQLEADFLRARESLWVEFLSRRDRLPPESWQAVVENLGLLDRVIRELRQALDEDPGNRRLEKLLLSNHQRQLDVLHRVTREV